MLRMQVYSERSITMHEKTTRVGEDAIPFVNTAGMFVADGMGGSAGIRVIHYDPVLRDPEALAERLMEYFHMEDLSQESRDLFTEYLRESFSSLLDPAMLEFYNAPGENPIRLKKSGFFGSHALGVVLTANLLRLAEAIPQTTYDKWKEFCESLKNVPFLQEYREVIDIFGTECARAAISKIDYYATTLSAAFFWEKEDCVEVFLINCGDSRTYVWDADGFRQAAEDQGRNGGMTANFSYQNDERVVPSFEFRTYKKPCMLFSVSDGIYATFSGRNGFHSIPMHMEGYLLNALAKASSLEGAAAFLKGLFDKSGHIDDSNSIAAAAFGFEDYEALKRAAAQHMQDLTERYQLDSLPQDILVEDYEKRQIDLEKAAVGEMAPLLECAFALTPIREHCEARIEEQPLSGIYLAELPGINDRKRRLAGERQIIRDELILIAEDNFFDFVDTTLVSKGFILPDILGLLKPAEQKAKESGSAFRSAVGERQESISLALKQLAQLQKEFEARMETIGFALGSEWTQDLERETEALVDQLGEALRKAMRRTEDYLDQIQERSAVLTRSQILWKKANRDSMAAYLKKGGIETAKSLVKSWLSAGDELDSILPETTFPEVRKTILDQAAFYHQKGAEMEALDERIVRIRKDGAHNYWMEEGPHDIERFLEDPAAFEEDPGLRDQIIEMRSRDDELVRMMELVKKQKALFSEYLKEHLKEVSQDKRDDVAKNGWM